MVDPSPEELQAAHDYRFQMQQRYGKYATTLQEQFEALRPEAVAHLLKTFPDLTEAAIDAMFSLHSSQDTPLDDKHNHAVLAEHRNRIARSAELLGYDLKAGLSVGILNSDGLEAMQQTVMMTAASVVMMTENLWIMCIRVAKLLAKSWPYEVIGSKFRLVEDPNKVHAHLYSSQELQAYWNGFFYEYAINPDRPDRGPLLSSAGPEENTFWGDLSEAMLLFVLGHEYGHHIAEHQAEGELSVDGEDLLEMHRKELEADHIGASLCVQSGVDMEEPNFFAVTNVGAVCVLICLEYARRGQRILTTGDDGDGETRQSHPPLKYRLLMVRQTTESLLGVEAKGAMLMQDQFAALLDFIWLNVRPLLVAQYKAGDRTMAADTGGWLPP